MRKQTWWVPAIQLGSTHPNLLKLPVFTYQETDKEYFTRLFFLVLVLQDILAGVQRKYLKRLQIRFP